MRFWLWILNVSWKLKWSSGDALLINYFRKAPARKPVWSNHETWRKLRNGIGKGKLGVGEGEVGTLFLLSLSILSRCFPPLLFFEGMRSSEVVRFRGWRCGWG